jgi:hypothetical protein
VLGGVLLALGQGRARAQDSLTVAVEAPVVDSTARARQVSPMGAFFRSLLLPGWGQAKLNRKLTGGIFVAWEGVTLGMTLKTSHELHYLRRTNSGRVDVKEQEKEDWIVLLAFNHLLSALEAYVSAHLWDFPDDLDIRAVPGGVGGQLSLPPLR